MVSSGIGRYAHSQCYERKHAPKSPDTFYEVARGGGDPVLAAELIVKYVPANVAAQILLGFRNRTQANHVRRCGYQA